MYTEFVFGVSLYNNTPNEIITILDVIVNNKEIELILPDHKLFSSNRYKAIANCCSYYFGFSDSFSTFSSIPDRISKEYLLSIRSSIKNYNNKIELFVDWLRPYINSGSGSNDLLGYMLYEEAVVPYLFYKDENFEKLVNKNINADSYIADIY